MPHLDTLDLIPTGGDNIVDVVCFVEHDPKKKSSLRKEKTLLVRPLDGASRNAVMLPRFRWSAQPLKVARGKTAEMVDDFKIEFSGRWSDIRSCSKKQLLAIVRKADTRVIMFDLSLFGDVRDYIQDVQTRGVTAIQATDIVCNELSQ